MTEASVVAVGLMSGTSADGIDAALVRLTERPLGLHLELLAFSTTRYPAGVRDALFRCFANEATVSEVSALHVRLGELFADAALAAIAAGGVTVADVALIASHGQTVWHEPNGALAGDVEVRSTLQLGQPAVIAERTGCAVVSDFRPRDMAAGGQGAPLVPRLDYLLFASPDVSRALQNIGGIANVTYLPAGAGDDDVLAFDTGPGNALMDAAAVLITDGAQAQDTDGRLAAAGKVDADLLARLLGHPYFAAPPPKSTGRELFGAQLTRDLWAEGHRGPDLVATLTELTAFSIAEAYRRWLGPVDEAVVGGGGARNPFLLARLQEHLRPTRVRTIDELGIDADAKEAIAFAVLGWQTMRGRPGNVPSATGATRPVVLGSITPGRP